MMKIFVIETLEKRRWKPLSFITMSDNIVSNGESLGSVSMIYSAVAQSIVKADTTLKIVQERFPEDKFRIRRYSREVV